jgi:4-hydroxythreonine-4-phosphate dehydrogenase
MSRRLPWIAVSIGCPSGVGPEVSVAAAASVAGARVLLVGDDDVVQRAARLRKVDARRFVRISGVGELGSLTDGQVAVLQPTAGLSLRDARPGHPSARAGAAQLAWIDVACDVVRAGDAAALVTGPVSKSVIASSESREARRFLGHTEHLQRRLHADEVVMAFACDVLTTALVTTHLPLARVPRAITQTSVATATFWLADLLARLGRGRTCPRVAVAALNPHAGEGGLLGQEEAEVIAPAIALARTRARRAAVACEIVGPVPAETAFRLAVRGDYDGVVGMYHDQVTIPMKLIGFGEAVNVSLGLPIIRTSVDHGTGYDIAGKGIADPRGMAQAMRLAVRLVKAGRDVSLRREGSGATRSTTRRRASL